MDESEVERLRAKLRDLEEAEQVAARQARAARRIVQVAQDRFARTRLVTVLGAIATFAATFGSALTLFPSLGPRDNSNLTLPAMDTARIGRLDRVEAQLADLQRVAARFARDTLRLDSLSPRPDARQIVQLHHDVDEIRGRMYGLERVILPDPAKAIEMVTLRNELNSQRENSDLAIGAVRRDVELIHDQSKWLIGLLFTMGIGQLAIAGSALYLSRRTQKDE